ncbi:hypothetical protein Taro_040671 [Colocasia esculenta]|uniref:Uncharacterized protein n=1 Tax=Colocasia esculenta TaxID=4460 RepID=A0A843WYW2_COLES|nr:hypothetical protein [Colocasia esculenta]
MDACATIADVFAAATAQGAEFSKLLLSRPASVLAVSAAGFLPVDALAPPRKAVRSDTQRAAPRAFVRRIRRTTRRSLTGDGDGEEGCSGDGDDGAFGGGGGAGGGGGGGRWWNFEGNGGAEWGDSDSSPASSDPAFDFVYGVISCVALYNCTQFAFKRVSRFIADKEKVVPLRLVPQFAD